MSLRRTLTSVRALAVTSCLLAFGVYAAFAPPPSRAEIEPILADGITCTYAGQTYSEGACRGGQRCVSNGNGGGVWSDDTGCKSQVAPVENAN